MIEGKAADLRQKTGAAIFCADCMKDRQERTDCEKNIAICSVCEYNRL